MTLLSYQVFKTVSDQGSFHKAADIMGLTPSAISHAISGMESELGYHLLTRSKSGISLTNYGEQLLPYVNAVLNSEESLKQAVAELNGIQKGKVKLGVFSSVCNAWVPEILNEYGKRYPEVSVEIFEGTYDDVYYWIKNGMVDFGFLSVSSAKDINIEPLAKDPLVCVMPKGHFADKNKKTVTVEEMRGLEFVTQRESTDADIQKFFKENKLSLTSRYHVVDDLSTVALVDKGFGICMMPELCMRDIPYDVDTYYIKPEAYRMIGLAVLNREYMAPAARSMYDLIEKMYKQ